MANHSATYSPEDNKAETIPVMENGLRDDSRAGRTTARTAPVAFKVRKTYGGGGFTGGADRVIVLKDKPQKPLPIDWTKVSNTKVSL